MRWIYYTLLPTLKDSWMIYLGTRDQIFLPEIKVLLVFLGIIHLFHKIQIIVIDLAVVYH
jgi:hypothetical protein